MKSTLLRRVLPAVALAALTLGSATVAAQQPPLIPRDILFGSPERTSPRLSPDGARLAWLAPDKRNVLQVWVKTIGKDDEKMVTAETKRGIRQYYWAGESGTLLYMKDSDGEENFHLYGADLATGLVRDYTPFQGVRASPLASDRKVPDETLVGLNARNRRVFDVYRVNLKTGALVLDTENPGDVTGWEEDATLQIRAARVSTPDGGTELRVRDDAKSPWKSWIKVAPEEILSFLDFTPDGRAAYLISSTSHDTARVVKRDLAKNAESVIAFSDGIDAGSVLINPTTHVVEAVLFVPGRTEWKVLDPAVTADFTGLRNLHDGDFNIVSRTRKDDVWLVAFASDRGPISYYLWNRAAKKGDLVFVSQPKLQGVALAEIKPVAIDSRDGLKLHAYLTLPTGLPPKDLPMVLLVHGGPWSRDIWGYNSIVQWLANRGYAVLQVNYRGSTGYGKKFLNAGNGQWGLKMQDDLIDGAKWAIAQGIVDPKKIAVYGNSYGGYAALTAATSTPDFFACNVDIVGPSNLKTLIGSIPPNWKPLSAQFAQRIGKLDDPKDAERIRNVSPFFKADKIVKPLLIAQGGKDPSVDVKESEQIVEAIKKNKGNVTYVLYPDEGHGLARSENRLDFDARAERFLAGCLGGRFEPMEGEKIRGSTAVVKVIGGN